MLDAGSDFLNTGAPTRQCPSTGGFSTPDVTIVHESLQGLCDWSPCYSLSSDHRNIAITLNLTAEHLKGQKRLVLDWKNGNPPAFTNYVDSQIHLECENGKMKVEEMHTRMSAIQLKAPKKHIGLKAVGKAGRYWMTKRINDKMKERQ